MTRPWWQGAVFYEVYVRSFADSNDDGVGDLPGITSRLDYLKRLGVDAVWLTPFYPSPQKDHGADGYRIDVASALFKRPESPSPARDLPEVHDVYRRWRNLANAYRPERVLAGEIFGSQRQARYIQPDQLNLAFALIPVPWNASRWKRWIEDDMHALHRPGVAPTWDLSNHDVIRHVTRFGGGALGHCRARAAILLLLGLPGPVLLLQGDDLGLEEAQLPPEAAQDPIFTHPQGRHLGP